MRGFTIDRPWRVVGVCVALRRAGRVAGSACFMLEFMLFCDTLVMSSKFTCHRRRLLLHRPPPVAPPVAPTAPGAVVLESAPFSERSNHRAAQSTSHSLSFASPLLDFG